MSILSQGSTASFSGVWQQLLQPFSKSIAWLIDYEGKVLALTPAAGKIPSADIEYVWPKHKTQLEGGIKGSKNTCLEFNFGLNHGLSGLFSCHKIQIDNQAFFLFHKVNPQVELQISNDQLIAEEYGIYFWHFHLESNRFFFSPEASKRFFGRLDSAIDYEDFYASLTAESLHRFSEAMESAINFGKGYRLELMIEQPTKVQWISFSCQKTVDISNSQWLTGLIKDLQTDKQNETKRHNIDQWLNVGLANLEVHNEEGEIIAQWGKNLTGPRIKIESGKRTSKILDFRNKPKFSIIAETGIEEIVTDITQPETIEKLPEQLDKSESKEGIKSDIEQEEKVHSVLPIDKLTKEEKCVALTQWLGQSLDVQISALGIFDGSRFEWKAWWKSPNRFALPVKRYSGEWLPELDWLVDVESDNQKFTDRYWWPQDMLPFQISESFGEGWMVLAEPISSKETTVFAIKTDDPEGIKEKTQHVLKSLGILRDSPIMPRIATVDELKAELARKDMLIKEMNHRAKNNLALAASLVKMQVGYTENAETSRILKQTQKRLETLASIHELMYVSPDATGTIDVKDYLTQLTNGLLSSFGNPHIKLELNVDHAKLDMKVVNTIGLLVNELISNTFKHAFTQDKQGVLKIDFLDKGTTFKLRVSDNGPGINASNQNKSSLGNVLIDEFVKQLHGSMEIDTSFGTTYLISLKKSILES